MITLLYSFFKDQAHAATSPQSSPLSSPSDYSPCQAPTICENSLSAHRFLQAVFHKKGESGVLCPVDDGTHRPI